MDISAIIPVAPNETHWRTALDNLLSFDEISQIILSVTSSFNEDVKELDKRITVISGNAGRAKQLNRGIQLANSKFIWMVHADSTVDEASFKSLLTSLTAQPDALYYFNLVFRNDGPALMGATQLGTWLRSHILGIPFGDQGLCLSKDTFLSLGELDENLLFGEDHKLVWKAKRAKIPIICTGGCIQTSARKYQKHGWFRVTSEHFWQTWSQAYREWTAYTGRK